MIPHHPHDIYAPRAPIGTPNPAEPADALEQCIASALLGDADAGRLRRRVSPVETWPDLAPLRRKRGFKQAKRRKAG